MTKLARIQAWDRARGSDSDSRAAGVRPLELGDDLAAAEAPRHGDVCDAHQVLGAQGLEDAREVVLPDEATQGLQFYKADFGSAVARTVLPVSLIFSPRY